MYSPHFKLPFYHWQSLEAGSKARAAVLNQEVEDLRQQQLDLQKDLAEAKDECSILVSFYLYTYFASVISATLYEHFALLFRKWKSVNYWRKTPT